MSPILLFFFMAIIEYGYAAGAYLSVNAATAEGLRVASVMGKSSNADWEIIQAVKQSTAAYDPVGLKKLVVFHADNANDNVVPSGCSPLADTSGNSASVGNECNGYSLTDFTAPVGQKALYDCQGVNQRSNGYCPRNRKIAFLAPGGPPDFVGVYLRYEHHFMTGMFGDTMTVEQTIITRVEPQEVS